MLTEMFKQNFIKKYEQEDEFIVRKNEIKIFEKNLEESKQILMKLEQLFIAV